MTLKGGEASMSLCSLEENVTEVMASVKGGTICYECIYDSISRSSNEYATLQYNLGSGEENLTLSIVHLVF